MIIDKISVADFGVLHNFEVYPGDGMNVIFAPNESGKSTLLAFIKFMFYGSRQKKEYGDLTFKEKYMPWNGMPMSGSIEFTHLGKKYYIYRSEGLKNGGKVYEIKNPLTGEPYEGIEIPGQYFFSVGERGFSQSCFVADSALITDADNDIISVLSGNGIESSSYQKVRKILDEKLLNLVSPKRSGSAYNLVKSEREALEVKLFQCEKELGILDACASKEAALKDDLRKTGEEICVLEKRFEAMEKQKKAAKLRELEGKLKEESDDLERLMETRSELDKPVGAEALSDEEKSVLATPDNVYDAGISRLSRMSIALSVLVIIALVSGLHFSGFWGNQRIMTASFTGFFVAGVTLTILAFITIQRIKQQKMRTAMLNRKKHITGKLPHFSQVPSERIAEMKTTLSLQIEKSKAGILELSDTVYALRSELSDIICSGEYDIFDTNSFTNEDLSGIIKSKQKHINDIKGSLMRISSETVRREELLSKAESIRLKIKKLSDEMKNIDEKAAVLKIAREILDSAFSKLRDNFAPALSKSAFEIFSSVVCEKYDGIVSNERFETSLLVNNEYKDVRYLSAGTKELVYLSLRIAESAYLAHGGVPVFLDDILMSFDDERCTNMLKFLVGVSDTRQIFLCTCRNREKDWCIRETNAVIIEL